MTRRRTLLLALPVLVVTAAAGYVLTRHETPANQQRLVVLNSESLNDFQKEFNRTANSVRILVLLSPT
jgi:hypothetical protein